MEKIKGFENYSVTKDGMIYSHLNNKFLKPNLNTRGYYIIALRNSGGTFKKRIHRIVAQTFIINEHNKPFVNHINGNKLDNRVENLEWCTCSENIKHAWDTGLQPRQRSHAKSIIDTKTGIVYRCIKDGAEAVGMKYDRLKQSLNGRLKNKTSFKYA